MNKLFLIPARGGSKGIPGKNIKVLNGKPLIFYSIDVARHFVKDEFICVSTDDDAIIEKVKSYGLNVPFKRPSQLATDNAGSYEVILHALQYYENQGIFFDYIVLLQPTSPFRKPHHVAEALQLYNNKIDMVVSVKETRSNPYYVLFEENSKGFLKLSKKGNFVRRQDIPKVYEYNGAIYIINSTVLKIKSLSNFVKVKKYLMDELDSHDLDTPLDWAFCEFLIANQFISL